MNDVSYLNKKATKDRMHINQNMLVVLVYINNE